MNERTNGLIHALHTNIFVQLCARIFRSRHTGYIEFPFELSDISHVFLEFERGEGREGETDDDDSAGESVGKVDTFREFGSNNGKEECTAFFGRGG
jgi:hypothetical protein